MINNEAGSREQGFQSQKEAIDSFLQGYLDLKNQAEINEIKILQISSLRGEFQEQIKFLADESLQDVMIVVVPDELWIKGIQPSESIAERNLVLFKESYFDGLDSLAWLIHELGHVQSFRQLKHEGYKKVIRSNYPDNEVERRAFSQQFAYLRKKGLSEEEILSYLSRDYNEQELKFLKSLIK